MPLIRSHLLLAAMLPAGLFAMGCNSADPAAEGPDVAEKRNVAEQGVVTFRVAGMNQQLQIL